MKHLKFLLMCAAAALAVATASAAEAKAPAKPAAPAEAKAPAKTLPLAEARAGIGAGIANPSKLTATMRKLSPADQRAFVAAVNEAIRKLPGSNEEKAAKALNANRCLVKGASKGNMLAVVAEIFATASPEALTVINERFAADLFNRDADPSKTYSDAEFQKIATEAMKIIENRTEGGDDAVVRNTLAALMFIRASNGSPADLPDTLIAGLPTIDQRALAKEWIPQAMAEGSKKSYETMLAYAESGLTPNIEMVIVIAGPQILDSLLMDMVSGMTLVERNPTTTPIVDQAFAGYDLTRVNAHIDTDGVATQVGGGMRPHGIETDPTRPRPTPPGPEPEPTPPTPPPTPPPVPPYNGQTF